MICTTINFFFGNESINSHNFVVKLFRNEELICQFNLNGSKKVIVSCETDIVAKLYHNDVLINTSDIFIAYDTLYNYTDMIDCCYNINEENYISSTVNGLY